MPSYTGQMRITAHECYIALLEQSATEIRQKTGKKLTIEQLEKGYKYKSKRKVGREVKDATVHFKPTVKDRRIMVNYAMDTVHYEMLYEITPVTENRVKLLYQQKARNEKENWIQSFLFRIRCRIWMRYIEREMLKRRKVKD